MCGAIIYLFTYYSQDLPQFLEYSNVQKLILEWVMNNNVQIVLQAH
jgi:hypothetical protein